MRHSINIGNHNFRYKKDALAYFRRILNAYQFYESLNNDDYDDLIALLNYDCEMDNNFNSFSKSDFLFPCEMDDNCTEGVEIESNGEEDIEIVDIRITKVQYNTKCFEVVYSDDSTDIISYRGIINRTSLSNDTIFNITCRNSVRYDIRSVKQKYFDEFSRKGLVPCQETGALLKWENLVVDHRQPNTFSIIIDRFKELYNIDINLIEYCITEDNLLVFKDNSLTEKFLEYHKSKAKLRVVKKECNSQRASLGVTKRQTRDRIID